MKIGREWDNRIAIWLDELKKDFYHVIGTSECAGFTTFDMLKPGDALSREFANMPEGTHWGRKWEYGWFRTGITVPASAEGRRIVYMPGTGGEMLLWVNGKIAGSVDLQHHYITLSKSAKPGERFDILFESYAGHGPRLENGGPYPPERVPVPEPPEFQQKVGQSVYAVWNEEAFQLWLDAYTLHKLLSELDVKSLRAQKIIKGLKEFTYRVDFEQSPEKRREDYAAAAGILKPLLECVNGSTAPMLTIFGQSHIDLAWKWPFEETKRKCARTLSTQLALMDEYPGYKFLLCEPPILDTVKKYYPELYDRIKEKISNGQIIPEGGFYIESDTNIPSGECLIRQFTFGKARFRKDCGRETLMAWLPDSFGFSAALPQIMDGCGIRYFTTQKILRCHPECDPFPYNIFLWEGHDGSRILSHMYMSNNSEIDPQLLIKRWERDRNQKEDIDTFMFPFGYGDGGGGPTRELCELANRLADLEGAPRTKMSDPITFFEEIEKNGLPKNRWVGELYLQWHRGAYTSLSKLKKGNRRAETALREAEFWSAVAGKSDYPKQALTALWEKLLFNQFHDIIAGTSITRVNDESERDLTEIISDAQTLTDSALRAIISADNIKGEKPKGLVLFNSLSWERNAIIKLPQGMTGARDAAGKELPLSLTADAAYVRAAVLSCGFTSIYPHKDAVTETDTACRAYMKDGGAVLENEILRMVFNPVGQIISIADKETGIEYADGLCNNFKMYKDVNSDYDAWEIGCMYENIPVELSPYAEIEIIGGEGEARGGLFAGIRVKRKLNNSVMNQNIILESGSRRADFKTKIDWRERHKLLKVDFPVNLHTDEALHEIQFGHVKRPTHKSRPYDADRFEVCNYRYTALAEAGRGFAVLNDCKYGVSTDNASIALTLLKAPVIPDMYADIGFHEFTYSIMVYNGPFASGGVTQSGCELNTPVLISEGSADSQSLFGIVMQTDKNEKNPCDFSQGNVIIETVKQADDNSGDLILRIYESQNTKTRCVLRTAFDIAEAHQTDMCEEIQNPLGTDEHSVNLNFRPFEVKTVRLRLK